jgi:hypothetical protein
MAALRFFGVAMTLSDHQIAEQSHQLLENLGDETLGLLAAIERNLTIVAAPDISWEMQSIDTGLLRALSGRRRDFLVVEHARFREYRVLFSARAYGTVLQASWLLVASPRLSNQVVRAMRLTADAKSRHDIGAELDTMSLLDLNAYIGVTRLCFRKAIAELSKADDETMTSEVLPDSE